MAEEIGRTQRCGFRPNGSRPQFQHSENCPSIVSPQPSQCHGFFTECNGANVFLRIDLARPNLSSSTTHSSGQHSTGGSSPAALIRSLFLATHLMPNVAKTFFKWPIINGSFALWSRFMFFSKGILFAAAQRLFVELESHAEPQRTFEVVAVAITGRRVHEHRQAFAVEHQPGHDFGEFIR
jgi:hypothetical protein